MVDVSGVCSENSRFKETRVLKTGESREIVKSLQGGHKISLHAFEVSVFKTLLLTETICVREGPRILRLELKRNKQTWGTHQSIVGVTKMTKRLPQGERF